MRRAHHSTEQNVKGPICRQDIRLDPWKRQVVVRGSVVPCSKQEFGLLYTLASLPGVVFTREQLITRYWYGRPNPSVRLIDPIISKLRNKIERDPDKPTLIITVWGRGYKFVE
jgi:DNA-binding response OmpR family regulator